MINQTSKSGFALLMTLIVVGVVLSIGLSILDLSIKQVNLSTNAKESETAFHAANAGLECAHYWRRAASSTMETGGDLDADCFGESANNISPSTISSGVSGVGVVYEYEYEFTWGTDPRCTQITTVVAYPDLFGAGITITESAMQSLISGFPAQGDEVCPAGEQCTTIAVRGYNRPCATATGYGAVQREVLLQF